VATKAFPFGQQTLRPSLDWGLSRRRWPRVVHRRFADATAYAVIGLVTAIAWKGGTVLVRGAHAVSIFIGAGAHQVCSSTHRFTARPIVINDFAVVLSFKAQFP